MSLDNWHKTLVANKCEKNVKKMEKGRDCRKGSVPGKSKENIRDKGKENNIQKREMGNRKRKRVKREQTYKNIMYI